MTSANRKATKASLGRTSTSRTPLAIRSQVGLDDAFKTYVRSRLGRALDALATRIERGTVRFEDVNGPRGGVDTVCRIQIVMGGRDEAVVVEQIGEDAAKAFARAVQRVARAVRRVADKRGGRAPRATRADAVRPVTPPRALPRRPEEDSLVGRREGRSAKRYADALERPEKERRDALVDTAAPDTSQTDRRAGGDHTARRNAKASQEGMTASLEDSLGKPSRKSTRRSAGRQKGATQLERRTRREVAAPKARARRANPGT